jgi:nucleotide-binding universal stress UspA family protein
MQTERILVPIDTERCHPEVFSRVNAFGSRPGVTIILLHVLKLNIAAADNGVYEKLAQEAHWHLEQLARQFLHPDISALLRVRVGKPVEEILAEAEAEAVDLIILPVSSKSCRKGPPSLANRLSWTRFTGTSQRLVRLALCPLLVLPAETSFDCHEHWTTQARDIRSALRYLEVISGTGAPSDLAPEDPFAQPDPLRHLAA